MKIGYFDSTGRVLLVSDGSMQMDPPPGTANSVELPVEATANNIYYAEGLQFRQPFPVTLSRNRIDGLPVGTLANGVEVNDGVIEYEADIERILWVTLDHPHYLYEVVHVETGP